MFIHVFTWLENKNGAISGYTEGAFFKLCYRYVPAIFRHTLYELTRYAGIMGLIEIKVFPLENIFHFSFGTYSHLRKEKIHKKFNGMEEEGSRIIRLDSAIVSKLWQKRIKAKEYNFVKSSEILFPISFRLFLKQSYNFSLHILLFLFSSVLMSL